MKRAIVAAVAADAAIAAVKLAGGALTGSAALVAEGIDPVVDGASGLLALFGERRSRRPATRRHPFGHGMEVHFWTVVVALVTFVVGGRLAVLTGVLTLSSQPPRRSWIVSFMRSLITGEAEGQPLVDDAYDAIARQRRLPRADELGHVARALERQHPSIRHVVFDFG